MAMDLSDSNRQPLLIYDGDCAFCQYSVEYSAALTGSRIRYRPYQQILAQIPYLDESRCRTAIQWIQGEHHHSGARAAFECLALGADRTLWLWLYLRVPGFAPISEALYRWVARHRVGVYRICRLLFGDPWRPLHYRRVTWLFLRCFALLALAAFASFLVQAEGLAGSNGILPSADFLARIREVYPGEGGWLLPTLFWFNASDWMIRAVPIAGLLFCVLLFCNRLPRLSLLGIYVCYLSIVNGVQVFFNYQWDVMLLETCLMALLVLQWPGFGVWLMRWFLFRFMWLGGLVKILSGDPAWPDLSALGYHFETQPLPTLFAWYAHQLPDAVLRAGVAVTLSIELGVVFLVLFPRNLRLLGGFAIALLQLLILLTGNYNFFNLLTLALCVFVLDDRRLSGWLGSWTPPGQAGVTPQRAWRIPALGVTAAVILIGALDLARLLNLPLPGEQLGIRVEQTLRPWHLLNRYGPFAVMTRLRREIIIEGSDNGRHWRPYPFRYKPQALDRAPPWVTPHQPRLDWQMWFAALGTVQQNLWFQALVLRLLQGSAPVLELFADDPFDQAPPRFIRAQVYHYRFTDWTERARDGHWWKRDYAGVYMPAVQLQDFAAGN